MRVSLPEGSLGVGDYRGVVSVDDPSVAGADVAIGEAVFGVEPAAEGTHGTGGNQQFAVEIRDLTAGGNHRSGPLLHTDPDGQPRLRPVARHHRRPR